MRMRNTTGLAAATAIAAVWLVLPVEVRPQSAPAARPANAAAARGEAWFYQRCSLCHMGRIVKDDVYEPMGPRLTGVLKNATPDREKAVRAHIQQGSPRMPGFQHSFPAAEFEELIAYMKTL